MSRRDSAMAVIPCNDTYLVLKLTCLLTLYYVQGERAAGLDVLGIYMT